MLQKLNSWAESREHREEYVAGADVDVVHLSVRDMELSRERNSLGLVWLRVDLVRIERTIQGSFRSKTLRL